jgi:hypothetical protein
MIKADTIRAAVNRDEESLSEIIEHYRPYIRMSSRRWFVDYLGEKIYFIDEEMVIELEAKLIYKIISNFDPDMPLE